MVSTLTENKLGFGRKTNIPSVQFLALLNVIPTCISCILLKT